MVFPKKNLLLGVLLVLIAGSAIVLAENLTGGLTQTVMHIILNKDTYTQGEAVAVPAVLTDPDSQPVPDKQVDFYLGANKVQSAQTNTNGLAQIDLDTTPLSPGTYTIKASHAGSDTTSPSEASQDITVTAAGQAPADTSAQTPPVDPAAPIDQQLPAQPAPSLSQFIADQGLTQAPSQLGGMVLPLQKCTSVAYTDEVHTANTCTQASSITVCLNDSGGTCYLENRSFDYTCDSVQMVPKTRQDCVTNAYIIGNAVEIHADKYGCTSTQDGATITVTCDSKLDGNGDGICTPGESCMRFIINGKNVQVQERNSRYDFTPTDPSFFLERASTEVVP